MKRCSRCKATLPLAEFNRCSAAPDGLQWMCRRCQVVANRQARYRNPERAKRDWRRQNARRRDAAPEKQRVHQVVARAIKRGELVRPAQCAECGREGRIEAHHEDYSRPLDVVWCCPRCHARAEGRTLG